MLAAQSFARHCPFCDSNTQDFFKKQIKLPTLFKVYSVFHRDIAYRCNDLPSIGVPAADTSVSSVGEGPVAAQHQHIILCPEVALLRPIECLQARLSVRHLLQAITNRMDEGTLKTPIP